MNPFEQIASNPRSGNGSAYEQMSQFGIQSPFAPFTNPQAAGQQSFSGSPYANQQSQQFSPQQQWGTGQQQLGQQAFPWLQQQQWQPQGQQFSPYGQTGGQQAFGGNVSPMQNLQQGVGLQTAPVLTTKAVGIEVNIPAQRVVGRHPQEVQQYVLQVVLPVLLDGLTKRALVHDVGQSISSDFRECTVKIEI